MAMLAAFGPLPASVRLSALALCALPHTRATFRDLAVGQVRRHRGVWRACAAVPRVVG